MNKLEINVTVVGLGLIGASMAMALRKLQPNNLWGVDLDGDVVMKAGERGVVDKAYRDPYLPISQSDLVIVALYPEATIQFIKHYAESFKKGALITDTGGIKERVVKEVQASLPDDIDFIGGHPMAGREGKGIDVASHHILQGANYILTPVEKNKGNHVGRLEQIILDMGFGRVVKTTPKKHDQLIALTSHLPHVLAAALMNCGEDMGKIPYFVGGSYKDATRVADFNTGLWSELMVANEDNLLGAIASLEEQLEFMKQTIKNHNKEELMKFLKQAGLRRKELFG